MLKLFLPFALLAARTLLPLGVDILSLKPCLFLLFLSDGWKVLLLIANIFKYKRCLIFQTAKITKFLFSANINQCAASLEESQHRSSSKCVANSDHI